MRRNDGRGCEAEAAPGERNEEKNGNGRRHQRADENRRAGPQQAGDETGLELQPTDDGKEHENQNERAKHGTLQTPHQTARQEDTQKQHAHTPLNGAPKPANGEGRAHGAQPVTAHPS